MIKCKAEALMIFFFKELDGAYGMEHEMKFENKGF